jgi:hypothetical protein
MKATIYRIIPNDDPEFHFFEVRVAFDDDTTSPQMSAEVIVFLEKSENLTLTEISALAIQKAHDFLAQIAASR